MRIAISSSGKGLKAMVSPTFGRAPFFIFVDIENGKIKNWEAVENPGVQAFRGAGVMAAQLVVSKKAEVAIAGNMGPNAYGLLIDSGIKVYMAPYTSVEDAIKLYLEGKLTEMVRPVGRWRRGWGWGRRW